MSVMAVSPCFVWIFAIISASATPPNILIFIVDDMPFLENWEESAPTGVNLVDHTVEYGDYPTPNIDAFRDEAIIFPRSYCGGPKCSPSRYSVLTGRMPSRSNWAIAQTGISGPLSKGTDVTVFNARMARDDSIYNVPRVLKDNGYYTGAVGKWHLMTGDDNGHNIGCSALEFGADADLYENCTDIIKEQGFDFVDAFFYANVEDNDDFTHNPEWIVSRAQAFIDEAVDVEDKPFFLYAASTLVHGSASELFKALIEGKCSETPKGTLVGDEVPDDTTMPSRIEIWTLAMAMANDAMGDAASFSVKKNYAKYLWMDASFGAIIDHLKSKGVYDNTLVILQNDHGQEAKGLLYEQGSRIINAIRYGSGFGTDQVILSDHFVVSNVDLAPTIFDLVGATLPTDYTMDGISWLDEVRSVLDNNVTTPDSPCCEVRFIDVKQSRSIVTADYQYIWRADDEVESAGGVNTLYANTYDLQQLYDLNADPDQQINLITAYESYREGDSDGDLSDMIMTFQSMMRDYIDETCPMDPEDGECMKPSYTFCTNIVSEWFMTSDVVEAERQFARTYPDCNMADYYYWQGRSRAMTLMEVCCADNAADGAIFPGDYTAPSGYSHSLDIKNALQLQCVLRYKRG